VKAYVVTMDGKPAGFIGIVREGGIGKFFKGLFSRPKSA